MRDFVAYVRRHLPRRGAPADRYDEEVDELASELEGRYTALVQAGASDEEAWTEVLAQVPSWPVLSQELAGVGDRRGLSTRLRQVLGFFTFEESVSGTSGTYYLPYSVTAPREIGFVIRSDRDWTSVVREVRSALAGIDRDLPLFDIRTLSERMVLALSLRNDVMRLTVRFAAIGMLLSALGLYGMLTYLVTQRTREIGVRLAVGGTPQAIIGLILREGLWLALIAVAGGAAAFLAFGRLLSSYLYGVAPSDPWVMLAVTTALSAVATVACVIPARRAARVDVMRILTAP